MTLLYLLCVAEMYVSFFSPFLTISFKFLTFSLVQLSPFVKSPGSLNHIFLHRNKLHLTQPDQHIFNGFKSGGFRVEQMVHTGTTVLLKVLK